MSNSYQNSIKTGTTATNISLKEKQLDNQKKIYKQKEDLKMLQQKYPSSMNILNPTQKQLLLLQQLQQQQRQLQQQQRQLQQQQQPFKDFQQKQKQLIYNKIQNKRKIDREKMLDTYIYDYCIKRDYKQTAEFLKQEAKISAEDIQQINSEGFLYEWWTVFWEIYSAKENNEEDTTPDALTYIGIQNLKAKQNELLLRQMNSLNTQQNTTTSTLTNQLLNPQLSKLQQQLQLQQKAQSISISQQNTQSQQSQSSVNSQLQNSTQQLQQLQNQASQLNKQTQNQIQSHSNSNSTILTSNPNQSTTLNANNNILPLSASGTSNTKAPQIATSSPQFNLNSALTGLINNTTYAPNLPNTSRTPLIQTGTLVQQPQQPTQSPHLSTNPSPQLTQGILRNATDASALLSNTAGITGSNANATLSLYAEAVRNSTNGLSIQDKTQLMKMVQNKVINQLKQQQQQQQKSILNSVITTSANTANAITAQNSKLGITTQINANTINNASGLKKSALSPTDSSQEMSPPPSKRIRANGVQYSPVITKNTIQSPVLTTQQQQTLNINTSPVINANGLLNDLSASQLMGKNWSVANQQLLNQQLKNSQNQLLLRRSSQIQQQQQQQQQLGLSNNKAQELLLQQQALQAQAQGLKNTKAQLQYNIKLQQQQQQQQSQNANISTKTSNPLITSTTATNFQLPKTTNPNLPQKNSALQTNITTTPLQVNKSDSISNNNISVKSSSTTNLKQTSLPLSQENSSTTKKQEANIIPITSSQQINSNKINNEPLSQISLFQNQTNQNLEQILQDSLTDPNVNDTDTFNKSMEILLNIQQNFTSFDNELNKTEFDKIENNNLFDSLNNFSNGVDEDPEKMFSLPVESVFYGTGSNSLDLNPEKQNDLIKKSNINFNENKNYNVNKSQKILTHITSLQGHKQKVSACCFDKSGHILASGSNDNKIIIWDIRNLNGKSKTLWKPLEEHKKSVNIVRFCNLTGVVGNAISSLNTEYINNTIPSLLVTGSIDKTVRIWKLNGIKNGTINEQEYPERLSLFEEHKWSVTAADFCPVAVCNRQNNIGFGENNKKIAIFCGSLDAEGELKIWNVINKKILKSVKLNKSSKFDYLSNPLRFRPFNNGTFFIADSTIVSIVAAYATSLIVIDFLLPYNSMSEDSTDDYTIRTRQTDHKKYISTLEWTSDGQNLITASEDMIFVWNVDSNNEFQIMYSIPSENEKIGSCIILPDPYLQQINTIASTSRMKNLRIAYSAYDNIYIWESDKTEKTIYNHFSPSVGKISSYNKAHTGTICSLSCFSKLKSKSDTKSNDNIEMILASTSNTKENNLKLWNINL
ncbi:WD40 repeat-like protein [Anaeromyces robustus]|uniref:WD40 repeat-like protein n=1 Tax=Anaeromyces robustus TaxID=1754192 RepID=A0A1Y1X353_9FUNG|nr:WD40 repeat-like protein [Anaeromyces robustus]|eukprot:ORX79754.1 WD40 repeat-like protein [Anaeromyces robustus]